MVIKYQKRILSILAFSLLILLTSCNPDVSKSQALEEQVMNVHDEVMPKMTDLQSSKKELEMALANGADSTKVFEYLTQLDEADEAMMVWMDEYESPAEDLKEEEKLTYLNLELSRIKDVKDKMLKVIKDVSTFTSQYIKPVNDTIQ
jgi:ABC-type oligopeptide transport system substrate-binding subunit